MFSRTLATIFTASLVLAPLGVAYCADSTGVDSTVNQPADTVVNRDDTKTNQPADAQNLTNWTKDEAMKIGVTEAQFDAADKNHDGQLDLKEIEGAGLAPKLQTSK